jgi:hypothetical protein
VGPGEPVGDEAAVNRGGDRPDGLAHDDDLGGVGIRFGEVAERHRAVDVAVVRDGQLRRVLAGGAAEVRVTGAGRDEHEAVVAEWVVAPAQVEDPAILRRIVASDVPVVRRVLGEERAGRGVVTRAATVEEEHDLGRVGPALPERELAAVSAVAVASRHHVLPTGSGFTRRRGRRQFLVRLEAPLSSDPPPLHAPSSPARANAASVSLTRGAVCNAQGR